MKKDAALSNTYFEIRRTTNNQLVYTGNTTEQGLNCGLFPKNETLTINLFSDCDTESPAGSKDIGPFSEDSETVIINFDELADVAITTLTATITNCSNAPLTTGYAFLRSTNNVNDSRTLSITNGEINQQFVYCIEGEYRMVITDTHTNEVSDEITITTIENGITNLGQLQTCPDQGTSEVYEGSITLTTQEQVDAFGLIGYSEITGDIRLEGQQSINSLASLSSLITVGGEFYMKTGVQSLTGLENLKTVGGNFSMLSNFNLTTLATLENLTSVGGHLWININENLTTLTGLESLTSVGSLLINSNENLTTLTGLENLTTVNESLYVTNHLNLTSIQGLNNITSVGLDLTIQDNDLLSTIAGLENLNSVARNLRILGNPRLAALTGLENLTTIGDLLFIGDSFRPNNALADFCALTNLFTIGSHGNVTISNNRYNPSVSDILNGNCEETGQSGGIYEGSITLNGQQEVDDFALFAYSEITGDLTLTNQSLIGISSIANLNHLTKIGGTLKIQHTPLTSLQGLENLTFIGENFTIDNNNNLTSLTGLDNLSTIQGRYVNIIRNNNLTSLTGLNNLTTINGLLGPNGISGNLYIDSNDNLTSLIGMESFTNMMSDLVISRNQNLTSLQGLDNVASIVGKLSIYENNGITSLDGLESLEYVRNTVTIGARFSSNGTMLSDGNPSLVDFCALTNFITNGDYTEVLIEQNGYNPTVSDFTLGNCQE